MPQVTDERRCPVASMNDVINLEPASIRCPYPAYTEQRAAQPVVYSDRVGAWLVTRFEDAIEILRDPARFSSRMASGPSSVSSLAQRVLDDDEMPERTRRAAKRRIELSKSRVLIYADPPLHKRQRALVSAGFTPKRVAELDVVVEELTRRLVDDLPEGGRVDLVPAFSIPIPMTIIATLLGVPPQKMDTFREWSNAFTQGVGALDQDRNAIISMFDRVDAFYDYFTDELDKRREHNAQDLLSDLLAARMPGEQPLTEDEILQMLVQFLVGGNETTTNLLTSSVWTLAKDLDLQDRLRTNPGDIPQFIEEMLRMEPPVQGVWRLATEDVLLGDTKIANGELIFVVTGSANHDPSVFDDPDVFDMETERERNLVFGRGEHLCLGMNLAKLEAKVALGVLLEMVTDISLADSTDGPAFHPSFMLHGITSLPIYFVKR
ncbi:cytochrome P450 [Rhodococcus opacus]|nr:cytochrome P450 [Rhodococcus opacus]